VKFTETHVLSFDFTIISKIFFPDLAIWRWIYNSCGWRSPLWVGQNLEVKFAFRNNFICPYEFA